MTEAKDIPAAQAAKEGRSAKAANVPADAQVANTPQADAQAANAPQAAVSHSDAQTDASQPAVSHSDASARQPAVPWYALRGEQVPRHLLFAAVVGVVTAFASILLCICIDWSYRLFCAFPWLVWALPVAGVLQLLLYRALRLPGDLTTHRVIIDIRKNRHVPATLAPGILVGTCMSMACGGSVGKEAGALQIGASLGSLVARPFSLRSVYRRNADEPMDGYAAATGMAACFAALFFAPIGAALFVVELSKFNRTVLRHWGTILLACFAAFFVANAFGIGDVINRVDVPAMDWRVVGQVAVVGLAAALAGTVFDNVIQWVHDLTWRTSRNLYIWVVAGGLLFAVLVTAFGWQPLTGSGGNTLNEALHGGFAPWDFAVKMLLTCVCLAFWLKGGEIMPSLCIGGLLGASCTYLTGGSPAFGAAVGCMAFLAAFSRCPLAAFFMGCEIFGWEMAPFLAIGVAVALLCGSPVGMYGDGIDRALRTRWHAFSGNVRHQRMDESEAAYVGALQKASTVGEALKETLEDPANETPHPN